MTEHPSDKPAAVARQAPQERRFVWGWWLFAAVALFYLWSEHQAHLFGVLPWLLLLACPLMHLFMHHGHGRHDEQNKARSEREEK